MNTNSLVKGNSDKDLKVEDVLFESSSDVYFSVFENEKNRVIMSGNYDYLSGKAKYYDMK